MFRGQAGVVMEISLCSSPFVMRRYSAAYEKKTWTQAFHLQSVWPAKGTGAMVAAELLGVANQCLVNLRPTPMPYILQR